MHNITYRALPTDTIVSPVTLSSDWSRVARLLLLAGLAAVGSVGNVFMISAVMIDDYLRRRGNAFIVNIALADFLVSGLLVPASAVVILAGIKDNLLVCRLQWFLASLCFLVSVLTIAAIAVENYARLCCRTCIYEHLTPARITTLLLLIWCTCTVIAGLQFATDLSFDYCTRKYVGVLGYQAGIGVGFVALPICIAFGCHAKAACHVAFAQSRPNFKPPPAFAWDRALMCTNLYSGLLFVGFWTPFGVVLAVSVFKTIPDRLFYNFAWLAISKSCVNSIIYAVFNRHFRDAYVNLFHYCCCKTTVTFGRRQRSLALSRPMGEVRVHMIHSFMSYAANNNSGCSSSTGMDVQDAGGSGGGSHGGKRSHHHHHHHNQRPLGRDVYEL